MEMTQKLEGLLKAFAIHPTAYFGYEEYSIERQLIDEIKSILYPPLANIWICNCQTADKKMRILPSFIRECNKCKEYAPTK